MLFIVTYSMLDISRPEQFPFVVLLLCNIMFGYGVSAQICPNAPLMISCNITTTGPVTRWVVPPGYCASNSIILSQPPGTDCGSKNDSCGPFVATNLVPPSGQACTTSVLSVVASPQLNGTNISCYSSGILQYQQIISITIPPGLPNVTVNQVGKGLVVSCFPGANGDTPTSYDITVEPNGTHIITAFNGMVEQNISGLLPNTTYTVRVIAINCAGSSGVVAVNATTMIDATQPVLPSMTNAHIAVGIGVVVGVLLITLLLATVIMTLCKRCRASDQASLSQNNEAKPKTILCLTVLQQADHIPEKMGQVCIIVCDDASRQENVLEVINIEYVYRKNRKKPLSSDQLWYRKDESDNNFCIVSMSVGKALKCDPESSQVVLCDISERILWKMEDNCIVSVGAPKQMYMYINDKGALYCGDKKVKRKKRNTFSFQKVVYSLENIDNKLVVSIDSNHRLVCSRKINETQHNSWYKVFPDYSKHKQFYIVSATNTNTGNWDAITCTVEGVNGHVERVNDHGANYLWKEDDEGITCVKCERMIGVQDSEKEDSHALMLCEKDELNHKIKMICGVPEQERSNYCTLL